MPDGQHILVTGGAGFIGSHLVDRLLGAGHRVTVLDDFSTGDRLNLAAHLGAPALIVVEGDVADPFEAALADAVGRHGPVQRVVHLAAQTSVVKSVAEPLEDHRVNAGGTLQALEYARAVGAAHVVLASSAAVYGDVTTLPAHEGLLPAPTSPYGVHKLAGEHYLKAWSANHGLPTTAFRFFNVYGPRQDPSSPYSGVISIFFERALRGLPLKIFGDGEQTRDFVYVGDVVEALTRALFRAEGDGSVMNVGTGREVSVNELARRVLTAAVSTSEIVYADARAGEIHRSVADISRLEEHLGLTPRLPLDEGLAHTAAWMAEARASQLA